MVVARVASAWQTRESAATTDSSTWFVRRLLEWQFSGFRPAGVRKPAAS